jgi:hypothetical protein
MAAAIPQPGLSSRNQPREPTGRGGIGAGGDGFDDSLTVPTPNDGSFGATRVAGFARPESVDDSWSSSMTVILDAVLLRSTPEN